MQYFEEQRRRGGKLIVVDPRLTPTAESATLHLQVAPGTDVALANALCYVAIRDKLIDKRYIDERTSGYAQLKLRAAAYWPDRVERICGVATHQIEAVAHMLAASPTAMILTARGAEQHRKGVDTVLSFINLALILGLVGRPSSGYGTLTGQGNGQGGREHGQKADQLPGYRRLDNPDHRVHMAKFWGVHRSDLPWPGKSAYELLDTLGPGGVRTLLVMGSNVAVSAPRAGHIQQKLAGLDFLAVADFFLSETAALADVVLPAQQWAEEEGTMTNLEGRVLLRQRAVAPPPGARSDLQIIAGLAQRLGYGHAFYEEPRVVFDELRRATAGSVADYAGISYERIQAEQGVFWPSPTPDHPGTPRLFQERIATPDGKARLHSIDYKVAAEEPDKDFPLYLTTGRVMAQYQSGTQTRRVASLRQAQPEAFVEIHPAMARNFDIGEGDMVEIQTRRGTATARARLTATIRMDTLFMPFHWGGQGRANLLTNPALDPISKMPEFKVCAAKIRRQA
jgi:assimilatory nitrate reductase catalytic subunit